MSLSDDFQRLPDPSWDDVERLMWHFWTPITLRQTVVPVSLAPPPQLGPQAKQPPGEDPPCTMHLPVRLPQWQDANFWSKDPLPQGEACISWYETWTTALTFHVPQDHIFVCDQIAVEIPGARELYEVVEFRVLRDGQELSRWEEVVTRVGTQLQPTIDQATAVAFAGHLDPIPYYGRFDHNSVIVVQARARGVIGTDASGDVFRHNPANLYGGFVKVFLGGWLASIMDGRDGAPRPVDTAVERDIYGEPIMDEEDLRTAELLMTALFGEEGADAQR